MTAVPFELLRSLSARRSASQLRALAWEGEGDAFVAWFGGALHGGYHLPEVGLKSGGPRDEATAWRRKLARLGRVGWTR